jgi:drug/metabolite transporter (DMT)-like permease
MTSTPTETQPLLKEKPLTFRTKLKAICVGIRARKTLFIYFTLLILFGIANNVAGRWNQLKFGDNYAFFNNQFYCLNYAMLAQVMATWKLLCTKDVTPEMRKFPLWKFAMFAFFDASAAFLYAIGAPNTPATLQNVINQAIIPLTMLVTVLLVRVSYKWLKQLGAFIILLGAGIAIIPVFVNDNSFGTSAFWYKILIYFCNNIPQAFSNVTKEMALHNVSMDVWYMGAWVAWFQLFWTLCFLPITALPGFGGIPFDEMPTQIKYGFLCFLGINSQQGDECSYNYIATVTYFVINFFYNILILLVTKHASATVFTIAFAVRLPLLQIIYCVPFIMQQFTEKFTWESVVALFVVLAGFALYSSLPEPQEQKKQQQAKDIEKGKIQNE